MKADIVLGRLDLEVSKPNKGETVTLKKEDAKLILQRVNHLESVAAALLKSCIDAKQPIVVPLNPKKPE